MLTPFESLCEQWQVPELVGGFFRATYLDICPPGLQPDDQLTWQRAQPLCPEAGEITPADRLPEAFTALPYRDTIYLTLGTVLNKATGVFEAALAGLQKIPANIVVTTGPDTDPAVIGPQPPNVVIKPYIPQALLLSQCRLVVAIQLG